MESSTTLPKLEKPSVGRQPEPDSPSSKRKRSPAAIQGDDRPSDGLPTVALSDPTVLDCFICHDPLTLPVFECDKGHIICSPCVDSSRRKCPSCSDWTGNIHRSRAIERVLESITVPCIYKSYGCTKQVIYSSKRSHEATCPCAPFGCPSPSCAFVGCERIMTLHVAKQHPTLVKSFRLEEKFRFSMNLANKFVVLCEEYDRTLFFLNMWDRISLTCIDGSSVSEGDRYKHVIIIRGKDDCLRFQSSTKPYKKTSPGKGVVIDSGSKDFVQVSTNSFAYDGCLDLEFCVWQACYYCPGIADRFVTDMRYA